MFTMKKTKREYLRAKTGIFFIGILLVSLGCFQFLHQFQKKEEKLNATYTAESTVRKIETQISRYLENADFLKNILASGYSISDEQFVELSGFMKQNKKVIEAYELAPDGIISQIYPMEGNEEAMGMDMLTLSERRTEAVLAEESKEYTIAGPYELKQGGMGALIFDPVYLKEDEQFWGFVILVLNWNQFVEELQIDKLEEAGYHFNVWKYDKDGSKVSIAECGDGNHKDGLTVSCSVPNDTWYFEIAPEGGWIPMHLRWAGFFLSFLIAALLTVWYWERAMKRYREEVYAENIEKAAKEAQAANEAKTRFLFNMSHDIRTPMNAIIGYANLLGDSLEKKELAAGYIEKIKASSSMLLSLINYILEMARIESGKVALKVEEGNLEYFLEILKAVSEPQIAQKKLFFSWKLDAEHTSILCDVTKVREIILNIVSNAIKYTPEGGKISAVIEELPSEKEGYGTYRFTVEDNGIGMSEDYLPHIFEEFSREHTSTESRVSGVGLGLPIVKSLVDMMDGKIEVASRLGEGTRFDIILSFPLSQEKDLCQSEKSAKDESRKKQDFTGKRLLLAEDNELNAEIAMEILKSGGFKVDLAQDGEQCISILDEKSEGYYDAVLLDIQMPKMNGYEAAKAIRKGGKNEDIPIIAMTANAFEEDREKALQMGMNAHVAKPIDVEKLFAILEACLKKN